MTVIEYFDAADRDSLIEKIDRSDWRAARYLVRLLKEDTFEREAGENPKLFLLMDGDNPVSFVTLTKKDCIADESRFPWLGFFYTFPEYRGQRLGGILLDYAAEQARQQGFGRVWIATDHVGLYEKYGFTYVENRISIWGENDRIYFRETGTSPD